MRVATVFLPMPRRTAAAPEGLLASKISWAGTGRRPRSTQPAYLPTDTPRDGRNQQPACQPARGGAVRRSELPAPHGPLGDDHRRGRLLRPGNAPQHPGQRPPRPGLPGPLREGAAQARHRLDPGTAAHFRRRSTPSRLPTWAPHRVRGVRAGRPDLRPAGRVGQHVCDCCRYRQGHDQRVLVLRCGPKKDWEALRERVDWKALRQELAAGARQAEGPICQLYPAAARGDVPALPTAAEQDLGPRSNGLLQTRSSTGHLASPASSRRSGWARRCGSCWRVRTTPPLLDMFRCNRLLLGQVYGPEWPVWKPPRRTLPAVRACCVRGGCRLERVVP